MKIIIPGGNGQVGQILARAFSKEGHEIIILTRAANSRAVGRQILWDGKTQGKWTEEIEGSDVLINLAGFTVNCRYNQTNRKRILESRTQSTSILREAVAQLQSPPTVWLNASTATIYRHALDRPMDEANGELGGDEPNAPDKWNFSIKVAKAWEEEFFKGELPDTRRVAMRSAMVMSPDKDGVFDVMYGLTRKGLGGTNGNGHQFVSWIHEFDFINAIKFLIERDDLEGAINLSSPNPLPNKEFMSKLRKAAGVPIGLPAMKWMLEIGAIFLKTETELILKSRQVVPGILLKEGFEFQFPNWEDAAKDICERKHGS